MLNTDDKDMEIKKQLFIQFVIEDNYEMALVQLVEMMNIDQGFEKKYAQSVMLRVFTLLDDTHPLISKFRSTLSRYTH